MKIHISLSSNINLLTEEQQIKAVQSDYKILKSITKPSLNVQLAAVLVHKDAIRLIKSPNEEVQLASVGYNPYSIQHIKKTYRDSATESCL